MVRIPRLLAISDRFPAAPTASYPALDSWLEGLEAAGIEGLQLRDKALSDRHLFHLARRTVSRLPRAVVLVNGRADSAHAAGAAGVHLPADGVPTATLRARFGTDLLIGRSTHHIEEIERERAAGADYVTFGPVFATPSKAPFGPPAGLDALRRAVAVGLPVLALGGIEPGTLEPIARAGAHGAAAIRAFGGPNTARAMVEGARELWPDLRRAP
jgi:thiamine-phosphate pyrophosphorylase